MHAGGKKLSVWENEHANSGGGPFRDKLWVRGVRGEAGGGHYAGSLAHYHLGPTERTLAEWTSPN